MKRVASYIIALFVDLSTRSAKINTAIFGLEQSMV